MKARAIAHQGSFEPGEHSQAAISISQMYNLTMMGGPVQVADNEDVRVEELDASSLEMRRNH